MQVAQWIAAHAVAEVLAGHNLTQSFPKALARAKHATPQQQAAAQDYSYLTCRFYAEAAACLRCLTPKPISDTRIHALCLVAISQLLHSSEDDFTVVNQAVNAAGQLRLHWAKGVVNAILRHFLRQRDALLAQVHAQEEVQFNYPAWWIAEVRSQYPAQWQSILHTGNDHPPLTLRVNLQQGTVAHYLQVLAEAALPAQYLGGQAVQLLTPMPVSQIPGFAQGWVSVQDRAAQWATPLLDVRPGMRVLDACSAPGGKTGHVLECADVALTALEMDAKRLVRVKENLQRLSLKAELVVGDASKQDWYTGVPFDRILADVPCSASGIVRRHVDMKWLRRPDDIARFASQQQQILANLWQMLAKNGKLLYVTCSIFQQENEMQIAQFLANHSDAKRLSMTFSSDSQSASPDTCALPFPPHAIGGQLLPTPHHDGLFYACLEKI